jgi:hypothetical protein
MNLFVSGTAFGETSIPGPRSLLDKPLTHMPMVSPASACSVVQAGHVISALVEIDFAMMVALRVPMCSLSPFLILPD